MRVDGVPFASRRDGAWKISTRVHARPHCVPTRRGEHTHTHTKQNKTKKTKLNFRGKRVIAIPKEKGEKISSRVRACVPVCTLYDRRVKTRKRPFLAIRTVGHVEFFCFVGDARARLRALDRVRSDSVLIDFRIATGGIGTGVGGARSIDPMGCPRDEVDCSGPVGSKGRDSRVFRCLNANERTNEERTRERR